MQFSNFQKLANIVSKIVGNLSNLLIYSCYQQQSPNDQQHVIVSGVGHVVSVLARDA